GYEINEEYLATIKKRLTENIGIFEQKEQVEIIKQERKDIDFNREIQNLPYIFKDPVTFERKIDPKLLRFGSRIDGKERDKARYYTVKEVISPSEVVLDTGAKIHLIGVKPNGKRNVEAIQFLKDLTKGQKVFLKFDNIRYDEKGSLYCYLYLRNKTFVNAHLIKNKLVDVDESCQYKYQSIFINYLKMK
ncbi:MAG: site-specific DNA-methyltransferase, partial [Thermodesulfovibrionales bacterium]|nr:site-specific DNA-methyltransferase [Thermodesulfovibrionales bacterium]